MVLKKMLTLVKGDHQQHSQEGKGDNYTICISFSQALHALASQRGWIVEASYSHHMDKDSSLFPDPDGCRWPPTYSNWFILAVFQFGSFFFLVFGSLTCGAVLRP
jgi:hypothetical protein